MTNSSDNKNSSPSHLLDAACRQVTCSDTYEELARLCKGGYAPTLRTDAYKGNESAQAAVRVLRAQLVADGYRVFPAWGPSDVVLPLQVEEEISDGEIESLLYASGGDDKQAAICRRALHGDTLVDHDGLVVPRADMSPAHARALCAQVIAEARMRGAE